MPFKPSHYQHAILCIVPLLKEVPTEDTIRAQLKFQLNEAPEHPDNPKLKLLTVTQANLAGLTPAEVASRPARFRRAFNKLIREGYVISRKLTKQEQEVIIPPFTPAYKLTSKGTRYVEATKSATPPPQEFDLPD